MAPTKGKRPRTYNRRTYRHQYWSKQALELWLHHGLSYAQIAQMWGCSKPRVEALVRGALAQVGKERNALAELALDQELLRLSTVLDSAYEVIVTVCQACHGHGKKNTKACQRCGRTGYDYNLDARAKAMGQYLRAADQRAKLLGLYAPEQRQLVGADGQPVDFRGLLQDATDEEIAKELQAYLQGVEDASAPSTVAAPHSGPHAAAATTEAQGLTSVSAQQPPAATAPVGVAAEPLPSEAAGAPAPQPPSAPARNPAQQAAPAPPTAAVPDEEDTLL